MGKRFKVSIDGETFEVEINEIGPQQAITQINKESNKIEQPKVIETQVEKTHEKKITASPTKTIEVEPTSIETTDVSKNGASIVTAPLPGKILAINVKKGALIKKGDVLLIIEAMKMENEIFAAEHGKISKIFVNPGDYIIAGQKLIELEK